MSAGLEGHSLSRNMGLFFPPTVFRNLSWESSANGVEEGEDDRERGNERWKEEGKGETERKMKGGKEREIGR